MTTLVISPEVFATEGGISRILRLYIRALAEGAARGDRLEIIALKDQANDAQRLGGILVEGSVCFRGHRNDKLSFAVDALIAGSRADRIVCGHLHQLIVAWMSKRLRPSLCYYLVAHGIEVWRPYSWEERLAIRGAEKIFCVSEYTRRQMLRFAPRLDPKRLVVLHNTIDPRFKFLPSESLAPIARLRSPRILVVSRLSSGDPYKGVDTMIEAMPRVLARHPAAQLRIVGDGTDRTRLEALAGIRQLGDAVHFCGLIDDEALAHEYQNCDYFGLPSRKEGFGLVYLEAMSYGKPCIAARAGGAPEVVTNEVGVLVEYGNADQIASSISDLIRRPRASEAILKHAAKFSFPNFRENLATLLQRGA